MKLRTTLAVVLLVVTILVGGSVYGALEYNKQQSIEEVQTAVNETADLAVDQIDADVTERMDRVGFIASRPAMANFNRTAETIDPFLDHSRFVSAQIVDTNGTVIAVRGPVTNPDEIRGSTVDDPYVTEALEGEVVMSEPLRTDNGSYVGIISAPIRDNGTIVGVFAAAFPLDRTTIFTAVDTLETSTTTATVRHGGTVVFGGDSSLESDSVVTGTAISETIGLTLTVDRDRSQLDENLQTAALIQGGSLVVILLSVVGIGLWEYRVNLTQTTTLLDGFEALRDGRYSHRLSTSVTEEWRRISEGFNDTATRLRDRETAIKEREQRLEVLNRVLRHNLSNDLTVVTGYIDMAIDEIDDDGITDMLEIAADETEGLITLGEKARQIDKAIESADKGITPVEITDPIRESLSSLRGTYPDAEIAADLPEEAWVAGIGHLGLAFENLCENALEHNTSDDPELRVSVDVVDDTDTVEVTIADNGPGLPEHEWAVLEEGEETPLQHGSGLGLWLVHWLVTKSDGILSFDVSDAGTTVACSFDQLEGQ